MEVLHEKDEDAPCMFCDGYDSGHNPECPIINEPCIACEGRGEIQIGDHTTGWAYRFCAICKGKGIRRIRS